MQYDLLNTLKTNLAKSTDPGAKIHPPLMALKVRMEGGGGGRRGGATPRAPRAP